MSGDTAGSPGDAAHAGATGATATAAAAGVRWPLLARLYGRIESLECFLERTQALSTTTLRQPGDLPEFLHVLEHCLVAVPGGAGGGGSRGASCAAAAATPSAAAAAAAGGSSSERVHASSQPEVVRHVIELLFHSTSQPLPEHVLALGHCRPRFGGTSSSSFHGVSAPRMPRPAPFQAFFLSPRVGMSSGGRRGWQGGRARGWTEPRLTPV
jgi:hypothetical protein